MRHLEAMPAGGEHIKAARSILAEHDIAVANAELDFEPDIAAIFAPMILRCTMDALVFLAPLPPVIQSPTNSNGCAMSFEVKEQVEAAMAVGPPLIL